MKKIIAFDLDGTLAASKSPITDEMSQLLSRLIEKYEVCVISGGKFEQFQSQLVANLKVEKHSLQKLHLMPTCGTRYYRYEEAKGSWDKIYAEDFTDAEKQTIIGALQQGVKHCGYDREQTWGEQIEDRGSQVTFSALGQQAPVHNKESWDPDNSKKAKLRDFVAELLPEFEVRSGGSTSIDITKLGIDKAYGMQKLMSMTQSSKEEILFIGDRLDEGGNDYPVRLFGVDSIKIDGWQQTAKVIEGILGVS